METLIQDLKYSLRLMWKNFGFTLIAALALALGIGANSAIFSVVNGVLLRPLPYPQPERLIKLWENQHSLNIKEEPTSVPNYYDWRDQNQSFDALAAFVTWRTNITNDGEPERVVAARVTSNIFSVLQVQPALGRSFEEAEDQQGKNNVTVLSHGFWQRRLGSDPNVIGRAITLNGTSYTVIGVMPKDFQFIASYRKQATELWVPHGFDAKAKEPGRRRADFLQIVGRLKPGVTPAQAQTDLSAIHARLEQQYPDANTGWTVELKPLHDHLVGKSRTGLLVLLGAVVFLLLIACTNVANLLLARATVRQREIAIRMAMGARRGRIVRQLLTESLLLSFLGGAMGLLLALWGTQALLHLAAGNIPRSEQVTVDLPVLVFTLGVSVLTGVLFGLVPALQASKPDLNNWLKEGGVKTTTGAQRNRMRNTLVVSEIALALVLLIGAGLMIRSFYHLQKVDPGFNGNNVLTAEMALPKTKYTEPARVLNFYQQLQERLRANPQVKAVGMIDTLPLTAGGNLLTFAIDGRPVQPAGQEIDSQVRTINIDYFTAFNIPLMRGRFFTAQDTDKSPSVVIINAEMARRFWPGEDPIGKRITFGDPKDEKDWSTIVGIVGNVKHEGLDAEPYPQTYFPHNQQAAGSMAMVIRANGEAQNLASLLRSEVAALDKELPLGYIRTMDEIMSDSVAQARFRTLLMGIFALVALLLAAVGIYGVMSYSVNQRTQEIGIRMALGASRVIVLKMVLAQGMKLALAGVVIGLLAAFGLARLIASLLYGVSAFDPITFIVIAGLLSLIALVACFIPALRATRVDPMVALRYE